MFKRSFHYLIASLPKLGLPQQQLPFSVLDWINQLNQVLHPSEKEQLHLLQLPADNQHLKTLLVNDSVEVWNPSAVYDGNSFLESLEKGAGLPAYLHEVYERSLLQKGTLDELALEYHLTEAYYAYAQEKGGWFVKAWTAFDRDLRNLLSAWNRRKYDLPDQYQLIGKNEVTEAIRKFAARDFGLGQVLPQWNWWVQEAAEDQILEREQNRDRITWHFIDSALQLEYFSVEVLLGYFLQLQILEYRISQDAERGRQRLDDYIQGVAEKFSLL